MNVPPTNPSLAFSPSPSLDDGENADISSSDDDIINIPLSPDDESVWGDYPTLGYPNHYDPGFGYPAPGMQLGYETPPQPHGRTHAAHIYNPPVPFSAQFPGGIFPGKVVIIRGRPRYLKFQVSIMDRLDIAMNMNAILTWSGAKDTVTFNIRQNGSFGQEERHDQVFPFQVNMPFEIRIMIDKTVYKVYVNGDHLYNFQARMYPIEKYNTVYIEGDVKLEEIEFR